MTLNLFRGRIKVMSTTGSHSTLNILETVRDTENEIMMCNMKKTV